MMKWKVRSTCKIKSLTAFTSYRKVTQSFSNPENCYDITRQLASFTAIKFTKRYGVSQWVSQSVTDKHSQWSDSGPIIKNLNLMLPTCTLCSSSRSKKAIKSTLSGRFWAAACSTVKLANNLRKASSLCFCVFFPRPGRIPSWGDYRRVKSMRWWGQKTIIVTSVNSWLEAISMYMGAKEPGLYRTALPLLLGQSWPH